MPLSLTPLFRRHRPSIIGLDIGRSEIRMVELSCSLERGIRLDRYAREALPHGAVDGDGIGDLRQVMAAAGRLWNRSGSQARQVAIGLPSGAAATQIVAVTADSGLAQRDALAKTHAARLLPYPPEQTVLDFCVLGPSENQADHVELLIAAARKEEIEDRIAIAESLGLRPVLIDLDRHAAQIALLPQTTLRSKALTGLLQLDTHGAQAALLHAGRIVGEQEIGAGLHPVLREIMHNFGVSQEQAAHKLHDPDMKNNDGGIVAAYLEQTATAIAAALRVLLTSARVDHARPLEHLLLAGAGATIPGLAEKLQKQNGVATSIAAPFAGMSAAPSIDPVQLAADAPALLIACGLAQRGLEQ